MRRYLPFAALIALAAASCGGDDDGPVDDGTAGGPPAVDPLDVTFETGEWEVPTGDVFECFYTDVITDKELAVQGAQSGDAPDGLHHITLYYTDQVQEPGHHPCSDDEMTAWRQVAAAGGGEADAGYGLPPGLAMHMPSGSQLVVQVHYINTTDAPYMRNDSVTMDVVDPADVDEYANMHVTLDSGFEVPAHGEFTSTSLCTVEKETKVVLLLGHMHEWGKHYKLERLAEDGSVAEVLYEEEWLPFYASHPPAHHFEVAEPLVLAPGTKLRQSCSWQNTEEAPLTFPREMCLSFMYYYPDDGERFALCQPEVAP
ncbi:MAG: hypothetical protein HOW73_07525 [Polyangiaceae bacterium]|nr:hypothetical protein [Polyangiaceae bacterium]